MDSGAAIQSPQAKPECLYFAYGSNLQLAQMAQHCRESRYMGIAYLHGYKFQINQRGHANVVPSSGDVVAGLCYLLTEEDEASLDVNEGVAGGVYVKEIFAVELFLAKAAVVGRKVSEIIERRLVAGSVGGGREGATVSPEPSTRGDQVSRGEMILELGLEPSPPVSGQQIPVTGEQKIQSIPEVTARGEMSQALVYISRRYTTEGKPREEYVGRMNLGITDALMLGVTEQYVEKYIRKYIPLI